MVCHFVDVDGRSQASEAAVLIASDRGLSFDENWANVMSRSV